MSTFPKLLCILLVNYLNCNASLDHGIFSLLSVADKHDSLDNHVNIFCVLLLQYS